MRRYRTLQPCERPQLRWRKVSAMQRAYLQQKAKISDSPQTPSYRKGYSRDSLHGGQPDLRAQNKVSWSVGLLSVGG
jgi:hypothetical protein